MIQWMAYAIVVGTLVAGAGWAAERLAESGGLSRRFVWLGALCLAVGLPLFARPTPARLNLTEVPATAVGDSAPILATPPAPQSAWWDGMALTAWSFASAGGLALIGLVLGLVWMARRRWRLEHVGDAEVYVSERFGPALVGVMRPAIVVPHWVSRMEAKAAQIIVRHEDEHRRAGDHLTLLFGGVLTALFPWNPAVWWMSRRLRAAVEIDCDRRLLANGTKAADYGEVLLQVGARPRSSWGPLPALTEPKSLLERRLRTMGEGRRRMSVRGSSLLTGLAVLFVATACETPAPTGVLNAMDRAIGAQRAGAQEVDTPAVRVGGLTFSGDTLIIDGIRMVVPGEEPLIFVNNELINPNGQDASVMDSINRDDIERIEVIKGAKARESFGPRGVASGVVQIYLKGYDSAAEQEAQERERTAHTARETAIERALEQEYEAVAEKLRESERLLEVKAHEFQLRGERELYAEELKARMQVDESRLKEMAAELRLRETSALEQARAKAEAAGELQSLELIQRRTKLKAQIEELTERLEQIERRLEERERSWS